MGCLMRDNYKNHLLILGVCHIFLMSGNAKCIYNCRFHTTVLKITCLSVYNEEVSFNIKPLFTICLRAGSVNTLPFVVLMTPGFNLDSSTKYGYTTPSNDRTNCVGMSVLKISNRPNVNPHQRKVMSNLKMYIWRKNACH